MELELRDIKGNIVMISEEEFIKIVKFGKEYFDMAIGEEKNDKFTKNLMPVVKELFDSLNDLNYECFKFFSFSAPSRATFERTTNILNKYREVLKFPNFIGDENSQEKGNEMSNLNFLQQKTIDYDEQVIGKPDWLSAPSWANWLGRDNNGVWHWFEKMPELKGTNWVFSGGYEKIENQKKQNSTIVQINTIIEKDVDLIKNNVDDLVDYLGHHGIVSKFTDTKIVILKWLEKHSSDEKIKESNDLSKPNWNDAPTDAKWLACDKFGGWNWHKEKPFIDSSVWSSKGLQSRCTILNWKNTLEEKPKTEDRIKVESLWKYNNLLWLVTSITRDDVWCCCLIDDKESKIKWQGSKTEFLEYFSEV